MSDRLGMTESEQIGCSDNSCIFSILRESGGMGTNGGCQCFERLLSWSEKAQCWNRVEVRVVKRDVHRLVAALREAQAEAEEWRKVARYYLGKDFVDGHGPKECREEAVRRAISERTVAERQREACAIKARDWQHSAVIYNSAEDAVRATPLVTEGDE